MSLLQKTAIITGATRGIGFGIANAMAKQGAQTILIGQDPERVKAVESYFQKIYGDHHQGVVLDVSDSQAIETTLKDLLKHSPAQYLVNAAGIARDGLLIQLKREDLEDTINTNLLGTIHMCRLVAKSMIRKRQGGCIINLSSVVGIDGNVGQSSYSASKAGIIGFTRSLAKELGPLRIRVNAIAPGFIETDMTADLLAATEKKQALLDSIPLRKLGTVEDVAEAAMFLAKSNYVHGQVLRVDGGLHL
ncbi:3-oxoacyl-reductase [Phycomyces blakesleeanus]|uniref:3-oxoacyl-reductase n=1 Tax=Phycomyces blakesleeanus TaxID=4837 RepID=A0ABR3AI52_PHYBL